MAVSATAKGIGISAKRLQRVVATVRGKRVQEAMAILEFLPTPAARQVAKAVKSAAANAENNLMMAAEALRIVAIAAEQGPVLRRFRARARGRAGRIRKGTSRITVTVEEES